MATIKRFEDLECWQNARQLAKLVFELSNKGAFARDFEHKNQINNAAGSSADNIAEGFGRGGKLEFVNFLSFACGSANEVKSQLYRALDKKYITQEEFDEAYELADKTAGKIGSMIQYLNQSIIKGQKFKRNN
jgi:four helix bundle protein